MAFLVLLFFIKQIANTKPTIINTAYAAKKIYTQGASIPILKCRMIKKVNGSRLTPKDIFSKIFSFMISSLTGYYVNLLQAT